MRKQPQMMRPEVCGLLDLSAGVEINMMKKRYVRTKLRVSDILLPGEEV
jgi:hypothetical protein